jgi:hypothetical protein
VGDNGGVSITSILLRFQVRATVRVTFRNTLAQAVLLAVGIGLSPDPGGALLSVARALASGAPLWLVAFGLWAAWNAAVARGPLASTLRGWHRHLPVSGAGERRAAWLALVLCQAPVLCFAIFLWIGAGLVDGSWHWQVPASMVLVGLASAAALLPWRSRWPMWVAMAAFLAAAFGTVASLALGASMLWVVDRRGGRPWMRHDTIHHAERPARSRRASLSWLIALRAIGWRIPLSWLAAALPLAAVWLFLRNNSLSLAQQATGARLGGGLALLAVLVFLAEALKLRRPPWPWIRSLPSTSRVRVVQDAVLFVAAALPPLWVTGWLAPAAALPLLAGLIFQSVRLAGALRREAAGASRLGGLALGELCLVQLAIAASGWTAAVVLLLVPWALRDATRQEQRQKVTRWHERHHLALGDPAS